MIKFLLKYKAKELRKKNVPELDFISYDDIKSIIVFYDERDYESVFIFVNQLVNAGKNVLAYTYSKNYMSMIPYVPGSFTGPYPIDVLSCFKVLRRNSLEVFGFPGCGLIEEIRSAGADTLADLTRENNPLFECLYYYTDAKYRLSFSNKSTSMYNLILDINDGHDNSFFIEQMSFYMKKIRAK